MDTIFIEDLRLSTRIGVYEWERHARQQVALDIEIALPSARPCASDELVDAVDYTAVVRRLEALAADHPHHLLERFADAVAAILLGEFGAPWVRVRVAKISPMPGTRRIAVSVERGQRP